MAQMITAEEIKEIRVHYGLSQKSFAVLLGIGPASIVRYEKGAVPSKANANLIRAARNPRFMQECLENEGQRIPNTQRIAVEKVIYDYISLDPEEDARMHAGFEPRRISNHTMDDIYHYTLQQEILNEQAANIIGDIMRYQLLQGEKPGQESRFLRACIGQLYEVKNTITAPGSDDDIFLEQIRGYLQYMEQLVDRLLQDGKAA